MKDTFGLDFCFKGKRKYVHGTDIFTKISKIFEPFIDSIDISFHGIVSNNMTFFSVKPDSHDIKVSVKCSHNNKKIKLYGIDSGTPINCRYTYNEDEITKNSAIDRSLQSITLKTPTSYSFIEHIVAMNKALLETLYTDLSGKWYFTRLQLKKNIQMDDNINLKLMLKTNFQFKLTKTIIIVNQEEIGYIYFSLIPKES